MKLFITLAGLLLLADGAYSVANACVSVGAPTEEEPCDAIADVVMLFDSSSSILAENYGKQFEWTKSLMRRFVIGNVRFGGVIFSYTTKKLFDLGDHLDIESLDAALTGVEYMNSSTYLHTACYYTDLWDMWSEANGGRADASKFLILVTDGNPNRLSSAYKMCDVIKSKGITILGVAVGDLIYEEVIANIASDPDDVFHVDNYDDLDTVEALVAQRTCEGNDGEAPTCMSGYTELLGAEAGACLDADNCQPNCEDVNECSLGICEDICVNTEGSYICACSDGSVVNSEDTDKCDEIVPCAHQADIVMVFDASLSVQLENFEKQKTCAKKFVSELGVDDIRFGAVVFSRLTVRLFGLGDFQSVADIQLQLDLMQYENSSTYLHTCFALINYYQMFSTINGGRDGVPDVIVLFTDGNPNRVDDAINAAQVLKDQGIKIVCVPIGPLISLDIVEQIVSDPPEEHIIAADDFDRLQYVNQRLASIVCGE